MRFIDLRSDTVTIPTAEMRIAMANAAVGDDVYREDPTVNKLEEKAAMLLGKERALFVSSGTMGNLLAILVTCKAGDEVIMGNQGHTFLHEVGGMSALGGIFPNTLPNQPDGTLDLAMVARAIRGEDIHEPRTRMVIIENTQNQCGGVPISLTYMQQLSQLARENELFLHVDGARIFNAAAALQCSAKDLVQTADSVTFCLSKGLCAPVGSVLCGPQDFIEEARRFRKMLGGGMRQVGILAAAGIIALDNMVERLSEDHRRATVLAEQLSQIPGFSLSKGKPQSNMVFLQVDHTVYPDLAVIAEQLKKESILIGFSGPDEIRIVTHYWVSDLDVQHVVRVWQNLQP
ncbi:MAG TPA: low-specificity L-threonine aldolase [Anaerolineaceae bacterium]|nr:low-specificity L-threonine aldolase [Anaerolineaceae bacterium]